MTVEHIVPAAGDMMLVKTGSEGSVAEAVLAQTCRLVIVPVEFRCKIPLISQSESPKDMLRRSFATPVENVIAEFTFAVKSRPTYGEEAVSFVVVPTIPSVVGEKAIDVAVAAPIVGVTRVGLPEKTRATVPVEVFPPVPPSKTARGVAPIALMTVLIAVSLRKFDRLPS